jgi:hypothetical protein
MLPIDADTFQRYVDGTGLRWGARTIAGVKRRMDEMVGIAILERDAKGMQLVAAWRQRIDDEGPVLLPAPRSSSARPPREAREEEVVS